MQNVFPDNPGRCGTGDARSGPTTNQGMLSAEFCMLEVECARHVVRNAFVLERGQQQSVTCVGLQETVCGAENRVRTMRNRRCQKRAVQLQTCRRIARTLPLDFAIKLCPWTLPQSLRAEACAAAPEERRQVTRRYVNCLSVCLCSDTSWRERAIPAQPKLMTLI